MLAEPSAELAAFTHAYNLALLDPATSLVWNPAETPSPGLAGQTLHLIPNSAWTAYGLLQTGEFSLAGEVLEALLALQFDAPGAPWQGTFRQFLEWPATPPPGAVEWVDYDPNWRQFVGTALALSLADFGEHLDGGLRQRITSAICRAAGGEPPDRLGVHYTNPALLQAWLLATAGTLAGEARWVQAGAAQAEALAEAYAAHGAFEEFNSPTYSGVDLLALGLWTQRAPTPRFAELGRPLEAGLWTQLAAWYHPDLRTWCGPFTRAYHPVATSHVTFAALWIWATLGRAAAPLPLLDADVVPHGHDLMAGPVVAALAHHPMGVDLGAFERLSGTRLLRQELPNARVVTSWIGDDAMVGGEASAHDWGGWAQFFPATLHCRTGAGVAALWLTDPHRVEAVASARRLEVRTGSHLQTWVTSARHLEGDHRSVELDGRSIRLEGASTARFITTPAGPGVELEVPGALVLHL